ncbi:MAG: hypothetical protein AB8B56_00870, partial [Crocinitomicaceae bacterium]
MKKILFLFLFFTSISFAQTEQLFKVDIDPQMPILTINGGDDITITNTLDNCLPFDDGTDCLDSWITYFLDFYLVQGQNQYLLHNVGENILGFNCNNGQSWGFN